MATNGKLKCNHCPICNGRGCIGELPGLGGVFENKNFQLNCDGWNELRKQAEQNGTLKNLEQIQISPKNLRCGPVTGAEENIGYKNEEDFYLPYFTAAFNSGIGICVGDGCPDLKLHLGIQAIKSLKEKNPNKVNDVAFFLKPYPDAKLQERLSWIKPYASYIGIDIDSYNILTMRNLVNLEKKTVNQLTEFRNQFEVPFVIKGVFTDEDLELVKELKPNVIYISNHGGRVETRVGSSAEFLQKHAAELKNYCDEIWVDGGIRTKEDVQTAIFYGADKVILARPFIRALFENDIAGMEKFAKELFI